ncbi:MAG: InlB B-repeat-containing protein [Clostridia bacterium]|nr:InlB B-repeat-containing protein [Clostridia bacterium]
MKKNNFKKAMSLAMAMLMILSCWVFIAPQEAEAATYTATTSTSTVNNTAISAISGLNTDVTTVYGSFDKDNDYTDSSYYAQIYKNVLYSPQVASATGHAAKLSSNLGLKDSNALDSIRWYYPVTTIMYDGSTTPQFGIAMAVDAASSCRVRTFSGWIYSGNNGLSFGNSYWRGSDTQLNFMWNYFAHASGNNSMAATTNGNTCTTWEDINVSTAGTDFYYANTLQFTGSMSDTEYLRTITPTWAWRGNQKTQEDTAYYTKTAAATNSIYVINYKPLKTALNDAITAYNNITSNPSRYTTASVAEFVTLAKALVAAKPNNFVNSSTNNPSGYASAAKTAVDNWNAWGGLKDRTFEITYDNMFSLSDWYNSYSSNFTGTKSVDITNGTVYLKNTSTTGEQVTDSSGSGNRKAGYYAMPVIAGKSYTFEYTSDTATSTQGFVFFYNGNTSTSLGTYGDYNMGISSAGVCKKTFTAPANATYAEIRFDVNTAGASATFSDIAFYEASRAEEVDMDNWITRPLRKVYSYNATLGTLNDAPVRTGYNFNGWTADLDYDGYGDADGNGTGDAAASNYASIAMTQSWCVYSTWNTYPNDISYDNLFSFSDWANAGKLSKSDTATITYDIDNGTATIAADLNDTYIGEGTYKIPVEAGVEYIAEADAEISSGGIQFGPFYYDESGSLLSHGLQYSKTSLTFTTPENCKYVSLRIGTTADSAETTFSNIRLYKAEDADKIASVQCAARELITADTALDTPVRPGYTFAGWVDVNGNAVTDASALTSSTSLFSTWSVDDQILTVDSNGGVNSSNLLHNPDGLSSASGGSDSHISYNLTIDADGVDISGNYTGGIGERTTMIPVWVYLEAGKTYEFSYTSSNSFTEFYLFPDGVAGNHASIKKNNGNNVYGEQFVCGQSGHQGEAAWTNVSDATGWYQIRLDQDCGASSDATVTAYSIENFTIKEVSADATNKFKQPTFTTITLTPPTQKGYTFAGWSFDDTTTSAADYEYTFAPGGDTLVAQWTEHSYKVVFDGNGATSGSTTGHTFLYDNVYNLNANGFKKENYHFIGWSTDPDDKTVEFVDKAEVTKLSDIDGETIKLYAVWEIDTYTITWKNEDGTVLETDENVPHGTVPTYDGDTPVKASSAQYSYTFKGWTPAVAEATGDTVYTAEFTPTVRKYTVEWLDEDGTVLETDSDLAYGTVISFDGAEPTKASTEEFSYEFAGWTGYTEGATVTDDVTYKATYSATTRSYTVKWVNWNGAVLETDENVLYGTEPSYDGTNPGRVADAQYTYKFAGWDKEIAKVTGDVTYTATYDTSLRDYQIIFVKADGSKKSAYYYYGTAAADITVPDNTAATYDDNNHYSYSWPVVEEVTGAKTYTEIETSVAHDYTGAIRNNGNTVDGTHSYLCTLGCGKYGNETNHEWNNGVKTITEDCGNDGEMTYTCQTDNCGAKYTEVVPATGNHTYDNGEYYCDTDATHQQVCDVCDYKNTAVDCKFTNKYEAKTPEDADVHTAYCICGNSKDAVHNWTDWVGDGNSSDNTGTMDSYCADCTQTRSTACTYEKTASKDATCTENGFETYECTDENCENGYTNIIPLTDHSWDEGTVTTDATCMAEGVKTFTCKHDASHTRTEAVAIDDNAHSWDEGTVTTDATCVAEGVKTFTCKHNSAHTRTEAVAIDDNAHSWDEGTVTTDATCIKEGVKTFTCKHDASHTRTEAIAIDTSAHSWDDGTVTTEATCSELGVKTFICKHNSAHTKTEDVAIDDDAHSWDEGAITTDATCSEEGVKTFTCKHNSAHTRTEAVAIDDDAHSWDEGTITTDATCVAEGVKTFTCKHNSAHTRTEAVAIDDDAHSWDEGTVTTDATCMKEGVKTFTCKQDASHTRTEAVAIDDAAHSWDKGTITKVANCAVEGERTYTCIYNDEHVKKEAIEKVEDGHSWNSGVITTVATCSEEGVKTYTCKYDSTHTRTEAVAINENAHSWDEGTVTKSATCSERGEKTFICANNTAHTRTEYIGIDVDAHDYDETKSESNLTRPSKLVDGSWTQGYYTFVCANNDAHTKREYIDRADYTEYDKVADELENILESEYITDEIKAEIEDALDDLAQNLIVGEEAPIEEATAKLEEVKADVEAKLEIIENCANGNHVYPTDNDGNIIYDSVVEATCTEDGYYIYSCIHCGLEGKETLTTTGHSWIVADGADENGWVVTTPATCSAEGEKTRTCEKGCTETEVIPATNHEGTWVTVPVQAPTCSTHGYTEYGYCSSCGYEVGKEIIAPLGHYDEDEDGKCDSCGRSINDSSSACGCICHKDNLLMRFLYRILRFLWKLFGIGRTCDCGFEHY